MFDYLPWGGETLFILAMYTN